MLCRSDCHNAGFNVEGPLGHRHPNQPHLRRTTARQAQLAVAGDIRQRATPLIEFEHEVATQNSHRYAPVTPSGFPNPQSHRRYAAPFNETVQIHAVDHQLETRFPSPMGDPKT